MNNISRKTAIGGLGETTYYKRAQSPDPEFKMALNAILRAVEDAGIKVTDIDGFSSYSDDRNSAVRLASVGCCFGLRLRYCPRTFELSAVGSVLGFFRLKNIARVLGVGSGAGCDFGSVSPLFIETPESAT